MSLPISGVVTGGFVIQIIIITGLKKTFNKSLQET